MDRTDKKLILKKGGHLFLEYSEWDGEEHFPGVNEEETPPNPFKLHDLPFEFDKGVTVEDLCLYLKKNMDYWEIVIGNWIRDYVDSCFVSPKKDGEDDGSVLEKCVLDWGMECTKFKGKKSINRPNLNFGMKGKDSDGNSVNYGFGDIPLSNIKDLPIEIEDKLVIHYGDLDDFFPKKKEKEWSIESFNHRNLFQRLFPKLDRLIYEIGYWSKHSKKDYGDMKVCLFDVLYGIFWELSFYGNPADRNVFFEKMNKDLEEFKDSNKISGKDDE